MYRNILPMQRTLAAFKVTFHESRLDFVKMKPVWVSASMLTFGMK